LTNAVFFNWEMNSFNRPGYKIQDKIVFHYQAYFFKNWIPWALSTVIWNAQHMTDLISGFWATPELHLSWAIFFKCCCLNGKCYTFTTILSSSAFCYIILIPQPNEFYSSVVLCCILPAFCIAHVGARWNNDHMGFLCFHIEVEGTGRYKK
jgi:hypothetical protein